MSTAIVTINDHIIEHLRLAIFYPRNQKIVRIDFDSELNKQLDFDKFLKEDVLLKIQSTTDKENEYTINQSARMVEKSIGGSVKTGWSISVDFLLVNEND